MILVDGVQYEQVMRRSAAVWNPSQQITKGSKGAKLRILKSGDEYQFAEYPLRSRTHR